MDFAILVIIVFAIQFFELAIILGYVFSKRSSIKGSIFLSTLILSYILIITREFLTNNWNWQNFISFHEIIFPLWQIVFLTGPLLFLYIQSVVEKKFQMNAIHFLHFLPFIVAIVMVTADILRTKENYYIFLSKLRNPLIFISLIHNLIYLLWSFIDFVKYMKGLQRIIINGKRNKNLILIIFFAALFIFWLLEINQSVFGYIKLVPVWVVTNYAVRNLLVFLFLNAVVILFLVSPHLFFEKRQKLDEVISRDEKAGVVEKLNRLMEREKIYRDPDLSLTYLSRLLKINPRYLSHIINCELNTSFTDMVNAFRLQESKLELLNAPHKTVQEIMFEVGFNSKSTFNTLFKKETGLTPKEYRQRYLVE